MRIIVGRKLPANHKMMIGCNDGSPVSFLGALFFVNCSALDIWSFCGMCTGST